jgi:hypothetical protein
VISVTTTGDGVGVGAGDGGVGVRVAVGAGGAVGTREPPIRAVASTKLMMPMNSRVKLDGNFWIAVIIPV